MPIKILMPALSPTMTEGNLSKWHKKEGDQVSAGDVIAEIETDKATMEVEAVDEGVLGKIMVPAGTKGVKVSSVIAVLLEDGEDKSAIKDEPAASEEKPKTEEPEAKEKKDSKKDSKEEPEQKEAPKEEEAPKQEQQQTAPAAGGRVNASPLAKKLGQQNNIPLEGMQGTGPKGRVVKEDVLKMIGRGGGTGMSGHVTRITPETSEIPLSTMRGIIATRLSESKQNIPHFYLSVDCNVDKLLEMRKEINGTTDPANPEFKISVNDLVIKAIAKALAAVPEANTMWNETSIIQHNNVDVSVAVAIEDGLVTPIIRNADQKDIFSISKEMKALAAKANNGTLAPDEFQGGSVTISNLGMYGIKQFNAIINPPQSSIFSVGAARQEVGVKNGDIDIVNLMNITISCDHRVVDGAVAAIFVNAVKDLIESPSRLLI